MKTIYLISDLINDTPTTKVLKFKFSNFPSSNGKHSEVKTNKVDLIDWWKLFNSAEEAEQYIETL